MTERLKLRTSPLSSWSRLAVAAVACLSVGSLAGCEKGEKSCRYYSMVLDAKGVPLKKRAEQLETIRAMSSKDQLKCDDEAVFKRLTKAMETKELRPTVVAVAENLGRASKGLRDKSEKLLVTALDGEDTAGQAAQTIRTWRVESAESGRDPWFPSQSTIRSLATHVKKYKKETKAALVEALFVSLATPEQRAQYEDLLIELASTDPGEQGIDTNLKALAYLTEIYRAEPGQPKKIPDAAFDAFVKSLYTRDATRAETYMAGRLALGNVDQAALSKKMVAIFNQKDPDFEKWAKEYGLADWEWREGPKAIQILSDIHDPATAGDLVAAIGKPVDGAKPMGDYAEKNKQVDWASYIKARFTLTLFALASMGEGLTPVADKIAAVAKDKGLTVEQRTGPALALGISGASAAWPTLVKMLDEIGDAEKAEFLPALTYAVDPEHLDEWNKTIATSKNEGMVKGLADAVVKARLAVVTDCKKGADTAADDAGKTAALVACYKGFLASGDDIVKEKAAIGLLHLGVRKGVDVVDLFADTLNKAPATSVTLRQVIVAGLKALAKPADSKKIYDLKEAQVAVPNAQTWIWDLEVLTSQLLQKPGAVKVGNIPTVGSQVKPEDQKPAEGAPPAQAK